MNTCPDHPGYRGKRLGKKARKCPHCLAIYNFNHGIRAEATSQSTIGHAAQSRSGWFNVTENGRVILKTNSRWLANYAKDDEHGEITEA